MTELFNKSTIVMVFLFFISYFAVYSLNYFGDFLSGIPFFGTLFPGYDWRFDSASVSPLYVLMPALGFLTVFFLAGWVKRELDWDFLKTVPFLVVFIVLSLLAFFFALWFFYLPQYWSVSSAGGSLNTCFYRVEHNWSKVPGGSSPENMGKLLQRTPGNCLWNSCFNCGVVKMQESGETVQKTVCQLNYLSCFGKSAFFLFMLGGITGWISMRLRSVIEEKVL